MNNVTEAILALSVGSAGSCVRRAVREKKMRGAYSRSAALAGEGPRRPTLLHGSGTKCGAVSVKLTKLAPVEQGTAGRRKALAGCGLQRSLAQGARAKKRAALNFRGTNSFQRGRSREAEHRGRAFPSRRLGTRPGTKWIARKSHTEAQRHGEERCNAVAFLCASVPLCEVLRRR